MNPDSVANTSQNQLFINSEYRVMKITPVGYTVRNDINPIARLNFGVDAFNKSCNQIKGIELVGVWTISPLSWLYDLVIYFYMRFFLTLSCQTNESGWVLFFVVAIYIALLIAPIISVITFCISAIFFLYYCVGLIIQFLNKTRLKGREYTERMVPSSKSPPFEGQNEYFQIEGAYFQTYIVSNNLQSYYQYRITLDVKNIMAYTEEFVKQGFQYIVSCKEIAFHFFLIFIVIIGLVISVTAFPTVYGRK